MASYIENRQIRVFISSTFEDMKGERDVLINNVFPRLNKKAIERGSSIIAIDLRWGITEENVRNGKVVRICLNEIDNSHPFFIGILGDRYGWCPNEEIFNQDSKLRSQYQWIQEEIAHKKSITEIEIKYGALRGGKDDKYAFFFIKEDSEKTDPNQRILKAQIQSQEKYPSYKYSDLQELELKVEKTFEDIIDRLFPPIDGNEVELDLKNQRSYLLRQCESYVRDEENFRVLDDFLYGDYLSRKIIVGEKGIGKSAFIANWIKEKLEEAQINIAYYFLGNPLFENRSKLVWSVIATQICDYYNLPKEKIIENYLIENNDELSIFSGLFDYIPRDYTDKKPLVIALDGCERYLDNPKFYKIILGMLNMAISHSRGLKVIISSIPEDEYLWYFKGVRDHPFNLNPLKEKQQIEYIDSYLRHYGKKLSADQIEIIVHSKIYNNPLALRILLDELISIGNYEKLENYIKKYCEASTIEGLYHHVIGRHEEIYGKEIISKTLTCIIISEKGMYEEELIQLAETDQLNWSTFYSSFSKYFYIRNGLIQLADSQLRDVVKTRYLSKETEKAYRNRIIDHLQNHKKIKEDKISRSNVWIWNELIHQYLKMGSKENLHNLVLRKDIFQYYLHENITKLDDIWRSLSYSRGYSLSDYLDQDINTKDIEYLLDFVNYVSTYTNIEDLTNRALFKAVEIIKEVAIYETQRLTAYIRMLNRGKISLHSALRNQQIQIVCLIEMIKQKWNINEELYIPFYWFIGQILHKIGVGYDGRKNPDWDANARKVLHEALKIRNIIVKKTNTDYLADVAESLCQTAELYTYYQPTKIIERRKQKEPGYMKSWYAQNKKLKQKKYQKAIQKYTEALGIYRKLTKGNTNKYQHKMYQIRRRISDLKKEIGLTNEM